MPEPVRMDSTLKDDLEILSHDEISVLSDDDLVPLRDHLPLPSATPAQFSKTPRFAPPAPRMRSSRGASGSRRTVALIAIGLVALGLVAGVVCFASNLSNPELERLIGEELVLEFDLIDVFNSVHDSDSGTSAIPQVLSLVDRAEALYRQAEDLQAPSPAWMMVRWKFGTQKKAAYAAGFEAGKRLHTVPGGMDFYQAVRGRLEELSRLEKRLHSGG